MGLPVMDGTKAKEFIHSLHLRSPRLCGFPIPDSFLRPRSSAAEQPVDNRQAGGANPSVDTNFHRFVRTASFAAKQLAFNQRSTGQHRGGPPWV